MSNFKDSLREILKRTPPPSGKVLSIGAQERDENYFGEKGKYLTLDINEEFKPDFVGDMNKDMIDEDGVRYEFEELVGTCDTVLALNLWEYIFDPVTAHRNIASLLKRGGRYIGNYPFVYGVHPPVGTDYLRYTEDAVQKLLITAGLTLKSIEYIHGNDLLRDFYYADGMRVRKDYDHSIIGVVVTAVL